MKIDQFENMVCTILDLIYESSPPEREYFLSLEEDELYQLHSSLGQMIRNRFALWSIKWEAQIIDGVDVSPDHPDAVSMAVITEVWKRLQQKK